MYSDTGRGRAGSAYASVAAVSANFGSCAYSQGISGTSRLCSLLSAKSSFEMFCIWGRSMGSGSRGSLASAVPIDISAKLGNGHQVDTLIPEPGFPPLFPVSAIRYTIPRWNRSEW